MSKNRFATIIYLLIFKVIISTSQTVRTSSNAHTFENESDCPVIKTTLGDIAGIRQQTVLGNNSSFCSYRGIPYAEAPTGLLRFKAPKPAKPWNGVLNASDYGAACLQTARTDKHHGSSENCLFLNVFVPNPSICSSANNIAVIVYIPGGGFQAGQASDTFYGPHLILNECVILVTLNYRVGVFGFLALALDEFSGNQGLKDQQLALEWINSHISAFGGNPNQITLMGQSAGATSVSFHRLNAKSVKLFKQAYIMSSSALTYYSLSENNNNTNLIVDVAKNQGIKIENTDQLIEYLRTVNSTYFLYRTAEFITRSNKITLDINLWIPCIEPKTAANPFLTENPEVLLANDVNIPTIYTYTPLESILYEIDIIANQSLISYLNNNFTFTLPFFGIDQAACKEELAPLFADIRRFYFVKSPVDDPAQLLPYIQLSSAASFAFSIQKEIAIQALTNPSANIRLLRVNQRTALNYFTHSKKSTKIAALGGATHFDDICSYFWCKVISKVYNEIELQESLLQKSSVKASKILREILTSFAITGNPVSETALFDDFPLVGSKPLTKLPFAEMHSMSAMVAGNNPDYEEFQFWWDIDQRTEEIKKMSCNHK